MRFGLLLILVGSIYLLKNMGVLNLVQFDLLWPIITILIGISVTLKRCRECGGYACKGECKEDGWKWAWWNKKCDCECEHCKKCEVSK